MWLLESMEHGGSIWWRHYTKFLIGDEGLRRLEPEECDAGLAVTENVRWLGVGGIGGRIVSESEDPPNVWVSSLVTSTFLFAQEDEALALRPMLQSGGEQWAFLRKHVTENVGLSAFHLPLEAVTVMGIIWWMVRYCLFLVSERREKFLRRLRGRANW